MANMGGIGLGMGLPSPQSQPAYGGGGFSSSNTSGFDGDAVRGFGGGAPPSSGFGGGDTSGGFAGSGGGGFGGGGGASTGRGCFKCDQMLQMLLACRKCCGCFKCGQEGHIGRDCPSSGCGGRPNGVGGDCCRSCGHTCARSASTPGSSPNYAGMYPNEGVAMLNKSANPVGLFLPTTPPTGYPASPRYSPRGSIGSTSKSLGSTSGTKLDVNATAFQPKRGLSMTFNSFTDNDELETASVRRAMAEAERRRNQQRKEELERLPLPLETLIDMECAKITALEHTEHTLQEPPMKRPTGVIGDRKKEPVGHESQARRTLHMSPNWNQPEKSAAKFAQTPELNNNPFMSVYLNSWAIEGLDSKISGGTVTPTKSEIGANVHPSPTMNNRAHSQIFGTPRKQGSDGFHLW